MHKFTNTVKGILLSGLILGSAPASLFAQQQPDSAKSATAVAPKLKGSKVSGVVTDAATGKGVEGIRLSVPGFSAAITDDKGSFKITVPSDKAVLVVSGPGYQTKEVTLSGKTSLKISIYDEALSSVYEDVSLPFASKRGNHIPYAVNSVKPTDNWARVDEPSDGYLQGKVAGLNSVRRSGTAGMGANLFLRGYNSLYTANRPLIVVDGVIFDDAEYGTSLLGGHINNPLQDIDLKDVDNITVLKDAAASIYGTKGANGVILITTARASEQATKIDFGVFGGYNSQFTQVPVMDAKGYRIYLGDLLKSRGLTDVQIQNQPYMNDVKNPATNPNYYRYHNETNWQNQVLSNSYNQKYYLKVTGGDDIATYSLSLGYLNNKGITESTDLKRYQTRFNADLNLSKRFTAKANLSFTSNEQNLRNQGLTNTNPLYLSLVKAPFLPVQAIDENGNESPNLASVDIFNVSNPVALINNMQGLNNNYRFLGTVGFKYEFNRFANLSSQIGVTFDKIREKMFIPGKGVVTDTLFNSIAYNRSGSNVERLFSLFNDTRFSYARTFNGIHDFSTNVGIRFLNSQAEQDYGLGYNSATDEFVSVTNGQSSLRRLGGGNGEWNWMNTYANANYEYLNKYMLAVNLAVDGSSRFGRQAPNSLDINGYKFAVLPSVAAGWLVSSESFMQGSRFFESLKLRASYGLTGNDDIGNYSAKQYYTSENFLGVQGLVRGNIGNPYLKWETVTKANVGLDASVLNERLSFSVDVFRNKTKDMLVYESTPVMSGFDLIATNGGGMETNGFEVAINSRLINKAVKWDMGLNLTHYKNKITKVPGGEILTTYANANILTREGSAANLFYGYKTDGVYASDAQAQSAGLQYMNQNGDALVPFVAGDVRFVDVNKDKVIDRNDMQVIGDPNPDFTGGFNNALSYKRWSLNALFTFSKGNDVYNYTRANLESMSGYENQTQAVLRRWRAQGQDTDIPRAAWGDPAGNSRFSDRWIEDGSYLRLRTLSVAYNFPIKNSALKYANIYLTGNNLFTLTNYLGYDPEFSSVNSILGQGVDVGLEPQYRTVQLGVRIGL